MHDPTTSTSETVEDREFEELLTQAFDAPSVPRSLLKRIDQVVQQEWGASPRLADSAADKLQRSVVRGTRWFRTLPIAAAVVLGVALTVFFQLSSPVYAWNTMVTALGHAGLVEIEQNGAVRWLSLSEQQAGETTSHATVLLDGTKNILLRRSSQASFVERRSLPSAELGTQDCLVLAFLMGDAAQAKSVEFLHGARVSGEHSRLVEVDGTSQIELTVNLESGDQTALLTVLVDPQSQLPLQSRFEPHPAAGIPSSAEFLPWKYRSDSDTALASRLAAIPASLPVVDVEAFTSTTVLANAQAPAVDHNTSSSPIAAVADPKVTPVAQAAPLEVAPAEVAPSEPYHGNLEVPASQWKPVEVRHSVTGNRTQDLDAVLSRLWTENQIQPASEAAPEELLRRVYLDLVGRTPSVTEVRDYLKDHSPDRYKTLVERLLNSPDHASHLAARFRSFLIPEGIDLANFGGIEAFEKWLSEQFSSGQSYDKTVQQLLLAEGRLVKSGPLLFYSATRLEPDQLAGRTARVFLGMRLECAQCHDHPFEPWKQEDFWGFAAFFGRISRPQGKLETVSTVMQVRDINRGEVTMPESKAPVAPKFLNATAPLESGEAVARRRLLTQWLTGKDNPYFARATANRVWSMLFGKGIVNPVDDFGVGNPPLSAELLDLLAGQFIESNFDLKGLFRTIALSRAYRLSSGAEDASETRLDWFAQMNVKMLTAEQVYDCITVATMPGSGTADAATGLVDRFGNSSREGFLRDFRTPSGRSTEYQGGIPQSLTLMNGTLVDGATGLQSSGLLKSLEAPFFSRDQRIEILYFATLARSPKPSEKELLQQYITENTKGAELREALSDVLWALLNSAEFTMNH